MRRHLLPQALVTATVVLVASGCNCGKPIVMMTQSSVSIPLDILDFGVVAEGTSKGGKFQIDNVGRAPVNVSVTLDPEGSADFALGTVPLTVEAGGFIEVPVTFSPIGPGSDLGGAIITEVGSEEMPLRVNLMGGPIEPLLHFMPNPLAFGPGNLPLERKTATIRSVGTSALNVRSVGVVATGNPNFSIVPPPLPARLLPGEVLAVVVEYSRTARTDTGFMEVLSDDVDGGGRRLLELFPDPPTACTDRVDNDGDGLTDFPADPGCQDVSDEDETNAAQCVNGATQPCDVGACAFAGMRTCANTIWGQCMGSCDAGVPDAGFDAGVDAGVPDAGCDPVGTYVLDAGSIQYSCCDYLGVGLILVEIDIDRFQIQANAIRPLPTQPGTTLTGPLKPMCPNGTFTQTRTLTGGCDETYTLTGTFVGTDTFVGTYTAEFSGAQCTGAECGGLNCTDQTWNISAGR